MPRVDNIYVNCPACGMQYTICAPAMFIGEDDEGEQYDIYPEFCSFCGNIVDIDS